MPFAEEGGVGYAATIKLAVAVINQICDCVVELHHLSAYYGYAIIATVAGLQHDHTLSLSLRKV